MSEIWGTFTWSITTCRLHRKSLWPLPTCGEDMPILQFNEAETWQITRERINDDDDSALGSQCRPASKWITTRTEEPQSNCSQVCVQNGLVFSRLSFLFPPNFNFFVLSLSSLSSHLPLIGLLFLACFFFLPSSFSAKIWSSFSWLSSYWSFPSCHPFRPTDSQKGLLLGLLQISTLSPDAKYLCDRSALFLSSRIDLRLTSLR